LSIIFVFNRQLPLNIQILTSRTPLDGALLRLPVKGLPEASKLLYWLVERF